MSQLTANTTSLQAILDAVNALPEAGGGGFRIVTGEVNIAKVLTGFDLDVCTVAGLDFAPTTVIFAAKWDSRSYRTGNAIGVLAIKGENLTINNGVTGGSTSSNTSVYVSSYTSEIMLCLALNSDGFTVRTPASLATSYGQSIRVLSGAYAYIAIG